jgi:hypothetical protein
VKTGEILGANLFRHRSQNLFGLEEKTKKENSKKREKKIIIHKIKVMIHKNTIKNKVNEGGRRERDGKPRNPVRKILLGFQKKPKW